MVEYLEIAAAHQPSPFILSLGDAASCQAFAVIAGHAVEAHSLLGAVDLCFKSFFVFDVHYTKQCLPTWEFLQHAVYRLDGHESSSVKFLRTVVQTTRV